MTQPQLVYLIDDDSFLLDMYAMKFKECGLPVEAITDAQVALQKIRDGAKPDIIIVDIIMPGMTFSKFCSVNTWRSALILPSGPMEIM